MAGLKQTVPLLLAGLVGACLVAVFIAPQYGALERHVIAVTGNQDIITEDFDYSEPSDETPARQDQPADESAHDTTQDDLSAQNHDALIDPSMRRIDPRPPLSDLGAVTPDLEASAPESVTVDDDAPMQLIHRPVAVAAGRFDSGGRVIDLLGIEIIPVDEQCQTPDAETWPCGMQARTAFRSWLRSRAVMCRLPKDDSGASIATTCTLGGEDAALWLVKNGWARARVGSAYEDAGRAAIEAHAGIFGARPVTAMPEPTPEPTSAPDVPDVTPEPSVELAAPEAPSGYFPPAPAQ